MDGHRINRRQFLESSSIFAGALLFAGLGFFAWQEEQMDDSLQVDDSLAKQPTFTRTPFQPEVSQSSSTPYPYLADPVIASEATAQPAEVPKLSATLTPQSVSVRCSRGCSYPGHCRRYIDTNQNNRCDLSEW